MKGYKICCLLTLIFVIVVSLCSCGNSGIYNEEDMLRYAKEHHGDGLVYSGSAVYGAETIAWFTADSENPISIPLVFSKNKDGSYELTEDTNRFQSADACYILWRKGVAVHIENTDIKTVMISSETMPVTEYPFNLYYESDSRGYRIFCLDNEGNVISEL